MYLASQQPSCGQMFLSFLLITESLCVLDEVGSPACGRKRMQMFGDPVLRFDTLRILRGKPHVLCHPRDLG